jgi:hypothetical protein
MTSPVPALAELYRHKGGLPVELQSLDGARTFADTDAYRHATVDERLEWVKAGIQVQL